MQFGNASSPIPFVSSKNLEPQLTERSVKRVQFRKNAGAGVIGIGIGMLSGHIPGGAAGGAGLVASGIGIGWPNLIPLNAAENTLYYLLIGAKQITQITAQAIDGTFDTFFWKTTFIQDRIARMLPTNEKIKEKTAFAIGIVTKRKLLILFIAYIMYQLSGFMEGVGEQWNSQST